MTVMEGAKALGISRVTLSRLVNGKAAVSAEMAVRLSKAFGTPPEIWLRLQAAYDLAHLRGRAARIKVRRIRYAPTVGIDG